MSQYCTSEVEEGPSLTVESCQGEADKDDTSAKKGGRDDAIRQGTEEGREEKRKTVESGRTLATQFLYNTHLGLMSMTISSRGPRLKPVCMSQSECVYMYMYSISFWLALNSPVQAPNPHSIPREREGGRERERV